MCIDKTAKRTGRRSVSAFGTRTGRTTKKHPTRDMRRKNDRRRRDLGLSITGELFSAVKMHRNESVRTEISLQPATENRTNLKGGSPGDGHYQWNYQCNEKARKRKG